VGDVELAHISDLHVTAPLGRRLPLAAGAHGKVLVGEAALGYDDEEYLPGVRAVAAPVIDARGRRVAAVIVVGFKDRLDLRTLRRIGARCADAAAAMSRRIGRVEAIA
ncbi:MAG: IclR family transcriptional regulator domain-containing protein, partial [Candidatus Limnocylindria bacterium]